MESRSVQENGSAVSKYRVGSPPKESTFLARMNAGDRIFSRYASNQAECFRSSKVSAQIESESRLIRIRDFSKKQSDRMRAMSTIETKGLAPWAKSLANSDSKAAIFVSGSYKSQPKKLRLTSDMDVLIFSSLASNFDQYCDSLYSLRKQVIEASKEVGAVPVFFTDRVEESSIIDHAHRWGAVDIDKVIPIHFLLYDDVNTLYRREPEQLASNLLGNSTPLSGAVGEQRAVEVDSDQTVWPNLRWKLEKELAKLVLNEGLVECDYRRYIFADNVYSTVRLTGDTITCSDQLSEFNGYRSKNQSNIDLLQVVRERYPLCFGMPSIDDELKAAAQGLLEFS